MTAPAHSRRVRRGIWGWAFAGAALVVPPVTLAFLHGFPQLNVVLESVDFHLAFVGAISACALGVALAASVAARRTAQGALVLLASGCLIVGFLMLAHGLTTPGTLGRPVNLWVARFPVLALAGFAACLAAAASRADGRLLSAASRRPTTLLALVAAALAVTSAAAIAWPDAGIGSRPVPAEGQIRTVIAVAAGAILLTTGLRHWRRWRLGLDEVQLALVVASWQGVGAVLALELGELWHLAWWDYHVFLLAGFTAAVYAVVIGARRSRTVHDVLGSAFSPDPLEHISRGYSEVLRALVGAVEARDRYTHGHSSRVAEWSVRIGQRLGLRPHQLRLLAEGAYLHDVGKIGIPDHILNKPGALTAEERAWIEQHPAVGVDIAERAPSLHPALPMIRHHHERYDGAGYPDRLAGTDIPLLARVVAVADVWDALTSDRAYRAAWTRGQALSHLAAGRGSQFDPACVDAFLAVATDHGWQPDAALPGHDSALAPADACHHHPVMTDAS